MIRPTAGVQLLSCGVSLVLATWSWTDSFAALAATPPSVTFSASPTVECRDATTPEFARVNPREKLIEATFRVSALVAGSEDALDEVLIVVASPERRLRLADFSPRTESTTDIVGPIERVESSETTRSLQAGIGGNLGAKYGPATAQLSPSASVGQTGLEGIKESFKKLPPKRLLVASGATDGEHGAFFKLKPSSQASLQGSRQFTCLFVVPRAWRGDWLSLTCTARAEVRRQFVRRVEECGQATFDVGLFLEGDVEAKRLAQQLHRAARLSVPTPANRDPAEPAGGLAGDDTGDSARTLSAKASPDGFSSFWHVCRKVLLMPDDGATVGPATLVSSDGDRLTLREARDTLSRLSGHDRPPQLP